MDTQLVCETFNDVYSALVENGGIEMNTMLDEKKEGQPRRIWSLILLACLLGVLMIAGGVSIWIYSEPIDGTPLPNGRQGILGLIVAIIWSKIGACIFVFIGAVALSIGLKFSITPSQYETVYKGPPCPKCDHPLYDEASEVCLKCGAVFNLEKDEHTGEITRIAQLPD